MKLAVSLRFIFVKFFLSISAVLIAGNIDLVDYGLRMGKGQLSIVLKSRKIEKFLNDPSYPDSLKKKILLIQDIKKFTVEELGFQPSPNYSKLYDQKGKNMMYVVTGSHKYALTAMKWKFPVVGEVTYKGFFTEEEADEEAARIEKLGYESRIRIVNAWSTLGWFRDPIMSSMLEEPDGDIAEVIIHELSHGTIFIKNNVELSENLANFIGEKGAYAYLENRFGKNSVAYTEYHESSQDYKKFVLHFMRSAAMLDSLYTSASFAAADTLLKEKLKSSAIDEVVDAIDTISFYHPEVFRKRFEKKRPNNALFIVFRQYNSMQDVFEQEFRAEANSDLRAYVQFLIRKYNH